MAASASSAPFRARLLLAAERRLPALTRLKQSETLPIILHRHRIYVLPTGYGLLFTALLAVMLLGALNYNNNPALLLTCLLGAAGFQSVFTAFRTLNGLELLGLRAEPVHAGDPLQVTLVLRGSGRIRRSLRARIGEIETTFDQEAAETPVVVVMPTERRGWHTLGRIRLQCEYPFGLFRVWSWLNPEFAALVYARPADLATPLPRSDDAAAATPIRHAGDEFGMLRDYHPSDPRRSIAWKASARHESLLVKEFEQRRGAEIVLDWEATRSLPYEARISRLTRWVLECEAAQLRYRLRLPDAVLGPGQGHGHLHACLAALAQMPGAEVR